MKNVSPLGYILGDEGSGASMGKYLLGNILKHQWPENIINRFHEHYGLTAADIIDRVYRQPRPNTFLASFMPFIVQNLHEPVVYAFVKDNFRSFLRRNVKQYDGWDQLPIGFNGSIAQVLRSPLEEVMQEEGMHLGRIVQAAHGGLGAVALSRQVALENNTYTDLEWLEVGRHCMKYFSEFVCS